MKDAVLVRRGIQRLLGLLDATDGAGEVRVDRERCALLGRAYKRLAVLLDTWSPDAGTEGRSTGIKQALEQAVLWYEKGEGAPNQSDFSPDCAQNRLALRAVLGEAKPAEAALALQAGEIGRQHYTDSRESFDPFMVADGVLIARLIDGGLRDQPEEAEREILGCYRDIREQLPESARQLDSVVTQIRLLAGFIKKRAAAEPEVEGLAKLGYRLSGIADLLAGKLDAAVGPRSDSPHPASPSPPSGESEGTDSDLDAMASPGTPSASGPSPGGQPTDSSKARKKRSE